MVAIAPTVLAGYLVYFVLIDLDLWNTGQGLAVILEFLFLVTPGCVG
jgi:hypothetical protein